jgi:hypothetical protein
MTSLIVNGYSDSPTDRRIAPQWWFHGADGVAGGSGVKTDSRRPIRIPVHDGSMRFLIDTNICIFREDPIVVSTGLSEFMRLASQAGARILIHPVSLAELAKDGDEKRREVVISKLQGYEQLADPPDPKSDHEYVLGIYGTAKTALSNDDWILHSVLRNATDFLVTEDLGIHRKARRIGLGQRVLFIEEARLVLKDQANKSRVALIPALKQVKMHDLPLSDPFFDYFKERYHDFEEWFERKADRTCYVHKMSDGTIGALLVLNIEEQVEAFDPPLPKKRRVKICLMRVFATGNKLGERFLSMAVQLAVKNDIEGIYFTHFTEDNDRLIERFSEYGFRRIGTNPKYGDYVYLKLLVPPHGQTNDLNSLEVSRLFYPSLRDSEEIRKFIVPIRPEFHRRLFVDFPKRQTDLREHGGEPLSEGNTIRKAYLCRAKAKRIRPGDLVLFYRSKDTKGVTSIGVVESVEFNLTDVREIIAKVAKRTVYSAAEISHILELGPMTVILFRHHFHLSPTLTLNQLKMMGVLKGAPQSIVEVADGAYRSIREKGGVDAKYFVGHPVNQT